MNKAKLNVYQKVLHKVCEKSDGAKEFIGEKTEEICCQQIGGRGNLFCF